MAKSLLRYIFRRVGGRVIPIRIGKEAQTMARGASGVSKQASRKLKLATKHGGAEVSKGGKLLMPRDPESSGTKSMFKFMDKTGAIRYMPEADVGLDYSTLPSSAQRKKAQEIIEKASAVYVDVNTRKGTLSGQFNPWDDIYRDKIFRSAKVFKPTKTGAKAEATAIKRLGLTDDPKEAGFILRDGSMLDLSGKKDGGFPGTRNLDHREVSGIIPDPRPRATNKSVNKLLKQAQQMRKINASMASRGKKK